MPVSSTSMVMLAKSPSISALTVITTPPSLVNFIALLTRFHSTCLRRVPSTSTATGRSDNRSKSNLNPFCSAISAEILSISTTKSSKLIGVGNSSSLRRSNLSISIISLKILPSVTALTLMVCICLRCSVVN